MSSTHRRSVLRCKCKHNECTVRTWIRDTKDNTSMMPVNMGCLYGLYTPCWVLWKDNRTIKGDEEK